VHEDFPSIGVSFSLGFRVRDLAPLGIRKYLRGPGWKMASEDDDIRDVSAGDERRGKRPIDIAARRRRLVLQRKFKEALESDDVELFKEAIINDLGWMPGMPEFENALKVWYRHHGRS